MMWSEIFEWAFHWVLLWIAFELGRRWNEKDVAAAIAAMTESQSRRRSIELTYTPEKDQRSARGSPTLSSSPFSIKEKRRLSRPIPSASPSRDPSGELRPLLIVDMNFPEKSTDGPQVAEITAIAYPDSPNNDT